MVDLNGVAAWGCVCFRLEARNLAFQRAEAEVVAQELDVPIVTNPEEPKRFAIRRNVAQRRTVRRGSTADQLASGMLRPLSTCMRTTAANSPRYLSLLLLPPSQEITNEGGELVGALGERDIQGRNALHHALLRKGAPPSSVQMRLLIAWCEEDAVNQRDERGCRPLHVICAVKSDKAEQVMRLLVAVRAEVDAADHKGQTPLHVSAASGAEKLALLLLVQRPD